MSKEDYIISIHDYGYENGVTFVRVNLSKFHDDENGSGVETLEGSHVVTLEDEEKILQFLRDEIVTVELTGEELLDTVSSLEMGQTLGLVAEPNTLDDVTLRLSDLLFNLQREYEES